MSTEFKNLSFEGIDAPVFVPLAECLERLSLSFAALIGLLPVPAKTKCNLYDSRI